jgi:hypothetical protein
MNPSPAPPRRKAAWFKHSPEPAPACALDILTSYVPAWLNFRKAHEVLAKYEMFFTRDSKASVTNDLNACPQRYLVENHAPFGC